MVLFSKTMPGITVDANVGQLTEFWPLTYAVLVYSQGIKPALTRHLYLGNPILGTWISIAIV